MSSSWPIGAMSFQLSIPWPVALQQSSPPLPQLRSCCNQQPSFVERISANGNRGVSILSQRRGSLYPVTAEGTYAYAVVPDSPRQLRTNQ